jgi:hypothetical protein
MGCTSSAEAAALAAPLTSRIDSTTCVPDDIFFEFLRAGKVARNSGAHQSFVSGSGKKVLVRSDLLDQHLLRRPGDRATMLLLPKKPLALDAESCSMRMEETCSTLGTELTSCPSDLDSLSIVRSVSTRSSVVESIPEDSDLASI